MSVLELRVTSNEGLCVSTFSNPSYFCTKWNFVWPPKHSSKYKIAILADLMRSEVSEFAFIYIYNVTVAASLPHLKSHAYN